MAKQEKTIKNKTLKEKQNKTLRVASPSRPFFKSPVITVHYIVPITFKNKLIIKKTNISLETQLFGSVNCDINIYDTVCVHIE